MEIIKWTEEWEEHDIYKYLFLDDVGRVVGSYYLELFNPVDWYLAGLYVQEEFRKRDYGNKILTHAMSEFNRLSNNESLYIKVFKNTFMYSWYERKGFKYSSECDDSKDWLVITSS